MPRKPALVDRFLDFFDLEVNPETTRPAQSERKDKTTDKTRDRQELRYSTAPSIRSCRRTSLRGRRFPPSMSCLVECTPSPNSSTSPQITTSSSSSTSDTTGLLLSLGKSHAWVTVAATAVGMFVVGAPRFLDTPGTRSELSSPPRRGRKNAKSPRKEDNPDEYKSIYDVNAGKYDMFITVKDRPCDLTIIRRELSHAKVRYRYNWAYLAKSFRDELPIVTIGFEAEIVEMIEGVGFPNELCEDVG
ncbi:hypothetical protein BU16DRAFT_554154 [Lophium mytilinum]|uniref:Uncharacterized protein n=1 Tax=Lophium mytilinum TaxID=390894 RepID=A0A6A6RF48_9PEZI|nr:hypothetical protein BU16DRAFT_554154 [Lophium mytilinum]